MTSGISAIGGSARKKFSSGSMNIRTLRYQPSTKPAGTANAMPSATPTTTRPVDIRMSMGRRAWSINCQKRVATCHGVGTSDELTTPDTATAHHNNTTMNQGVAISSSRREIGIDWALGGGEAADA